MTSLRLVVALGLLLAATLVRADGPTKAVKPPESEYRRPELIAIAWQQSTNPRFESEPTAVWRPDGSLIDGEELDWLRKDLRTLNSHWRSTNTELRPLVFVFRIDERAQSPQTLMGSLLIDGRPHPSGSAIRSTSNYLAKMSLAPNRAELASWRHEIDIEVRAPIGELETVKSFERLPDGKFEIERGVRWYVDPSRGIRAEKGKRVTGLPAAVLEIDRTIADPLSTISGVVWTKHGGVLSESYVTMADEAGTVEIRVSAPLDESNPIVRGEFHRLRYRLERYEKLPVRLDLKPEDPKPPPAVPAPPPFKSL